MFNEDATVNANGGKYEGMDRYECRKAVVADLEEGGYLVKIEDHEHNVGTCYRCGTTVEPMTSAQWFVKMAPLAKPAMDVVNEGKTRFVPEPFLPRPICAGWRTYTTGAFRVSSGGVTVFRRSTARIAAK